jgi:hypothetical protein
MNEERRKVFSALKTARWLTAEEIGVRIHVLRSLQREGWLETAYPYELREQERTVRKLLWHIRDHKREHARKELRGGNKRGA